jgi:hypothetical protein
MPDAIDIRSILEGAKITVFIQDGVLYEARISAADVARLVQSIRELYAKREHELLTEYVSPDETRNALAAERARNYDDIDTLIRGYEASLKAGGKPTEKLLIARIREDFDSLRKKQDK